MTDAAQRFIDQLGLDWGVEIVEGSSIFAASQETKKIQIGSKKNQLSRIDLQAVLLHEVAVHALRRFNGENSEVPALGLGLDSSLAADEGFASVIAASWNGKAAVPGAAPYLNAGLAMGSMEGDAPRDFRDVFEIAWRRIAVEGLGKRADGEITVDDISRAKRTALLQTTRLFRGTTCDVPGVIFTKDISYHFAVETVEFLDQMPDDDFLHLFAGKFDYTRSEHDEIVAVSLAS